MSDEEYVEDMEGIDDGEDVIRAKWAMDGAATLADAAAKLRAMADDLDRLAAEGWQLTGPVADDYGFIRQEGGRG